MTTETKRITLVCRHCGSNDVCRDAWAEWNDEAQEWVLGAVFDQGYCNSCEGEASLDEKDLPL